MKLLTNIIGFFVVTFFLSSAVWADTMTIPNTFTSGEKAVAADVNANFSAAKAAVDDNHGRITTLEGLSPTIGNNSNRINALENPSADFVSSIELTVGRPEGYTSGSVIFHFLLSNKTGVSCDMFTGATSSGWKIGANTKGLFIVFPTYAADLLAGITKTGFPVISTTHTIVDRSFAVDFSTDDYVQVTLFRSESAVEDTCNSTDVMVRGVLVTYPAAAVGDREFIAPNQLRIR